MLPAVSIVEGPCSHPAISHYMESCAQMSKAVVIVIATDGKQPRCPSEGERVNTLRCILRMEYYSAMKSELLMHRAIWMDHKSIMLILFK